MTSSVTPSASPLLTPRLVDDYLTAQRQAAPECFDAMLDGDGQLRSGWKSLLITLEKLGDDGRRQQDEEVQRLLAENGVIFNMHAENQGRGWRVDPLPWVIEATEWQALSAGLAQRSRLLSALYQDIYGPRTLFKAGILSARGLLATPELLLPCYRSLPSDHPPFTFHAIDVIRDAKGQWRVLTDRLQAPAGIGFALENRILMARALPDMYRNALLKRLASFLDQHRRALIALANEHREAPNVVLFSPGPSSPRYFEHAYLANYLNLPLVEGQDMVVRDARVWLRTLGGLKAVDVILRQCLDALCDPLELRGDSSVGVPGLLQAVRAGKVALSNAPGVGILEAAPLRDELPRLCQHLLGETLLLGNAHPDTPASTTPVFDPTLKRLVPTTLNLRCFTSRTPETLKAKGTHNHGEYHVMPGGLAWAGQPGSSSLGAQVVKDVWVTADTPQPHVSQMRQAHSPVVTTRDGLDLPSRVAEHLFWLGRYGERLDIRARLLREALLRLMEYEQDALADGLLDQLLLSLNIQLTEQDSTADSHFARKRGALLDQFDEHNPLALQALFNQLLNNARSIRDHLGDDSWRVLNQLGQRVDWHTAAFSTSTARRTCESLSAQLAAFYGLCNETMPHHFGWRFMDIGRFIDRLLGLLSLLQRILHAPDSPGQALWEVALSTTDNFTAYRRRYRSELNPAAILDLLLFDESNPRSVGYMLKRLERQINRLPSDETPYRNSERRLLIQANAALHLADIEKLSRVGETQEASQALNTLINELITPLGMLSDAISQSHFSHVEQAQQLISMEPGQ